MGLGIRTTIRRQFRKIRLASWLVQTRPNPEREAILLSHALDKGMIVPEPRRDFGREKAQKLLKVLEKLTETGKASSYAFQEGLAVLKAYCDFQRQKGTEIPEIAEETEALYREYSPSLGGGYEVLSKETLDKGLEMDFAAFTKSRHSMRTFSKDPISREEILKAVRIAKTCPSACNRQPWKFYTSQSGETNRAIRQAIPPQPLLEGIPYFGVVTVDKTLFGDLETCQEYINGGIFLGFLSLAFHSLGIGSCIFQYQLFSKTEPELRQALQIPEEERIIAAVGFGKHPEEARCIRAERRPDDEIAVFR